MLSWSNDTAQADWIELAEFGTGAGAVIPGGFEAYARLRHPIPASGSPVRWREVAAWSGLPLDPDTQYVEIAAPEQQPDAPNPAADGLPTEGTLQDDTGALVRILAEHGPGQVWFCFWEGFGIWTVGSSMMLRRHNTLRRTLTWLVPPPLRADARMPRRIRAAGVRPQILRPSIWFRRPQPAAVGWTSYGSAPQPRTSGLVPQSVLDGPRVELPHRSYLLASGPVEAALTFVDEHGQSPNVWWAADRSWCVATEIDLDCTFVGGSRELISAILAEPELEAVPLDPAEQISARYPSWIEAAANRILADLPRGGQATLAPGWPHISVTLRLPHPGRDGELRVTHPGGWANHLLNRRHDRDRLLPILTRQLTDAVLNDKPPSIP